MSEMANIGREIIITAIVTVAANVVTALVISKKDTILAAMGLATTAIGRRLPYAFSLFIDLLVTIYLASQIYLVINDPAAPTRAESALIAFWVCVLLWFAKRAFLDPLLRWRRSR